MIDRYAVMGHPVAHSKSPFIHARFAEQTAQAMSYEAIDVAPGEFAEAVEAFRAAGGRGLNVTVPFKEEAWRLVAERSARAERAGAVNTIWFEDDTAHGDVTDGAGLLRDLVVNHGATLAGRRILLLGAGGAARGVLEPLLHAGPTRVVVANRTAARARALARAFAADGPVSGCGLDELRAEGAFDLIINATSASLVGEVPRVPAAALGPDTWCYDMVYGDAPTVFMDWARRHGASVVLDGLGMLVEQAAEAFALWRGVRPETAPVIAALRGAT